MRKVIFITLFLLCSLFSSEIKELKSIDEIKENKNTFLVFSTTYCPWCSKQKRVLEEIDIEKDDFQMFYVNDSSEIYKDLLNKYSFTIKFFPTSYIVVKEEGKLDILYEFQGYQKKASILKVLNDEDSF